MFRFQQKYQNVLIHFCFLLIRHDESQRENVTVGTAMLLEYLRNKQQYDKHDTYIVEYSFCLGSDAFLDLTAGKWKQSEKIISMLNGRFLVLYRNQNTFQQQYSSTASDKFLIDGNSSRADMDAVHERIRVHCPKAKFLQMEHLDDVSSTKVRDCSDLSLLSSMLSTPVLEYIQLHQLYQFQSMTA
jgi:nicotinic acid mononucleotide adenylyltransferase